MPLSTFPIGGLLLEPNKRRTASEPIRNAIIPSVSLVPFRQSRAEATIRIVNAGDRVGEGMRIGRGASRRAPSLHSPVPGVVSEIRSVVLADGSESDAALITVDGEFERLGKPARHHDWRSYTPAKLRNLLDDAGIVELSFPAESASVSYSETVAARCSTLLINGSESEPYLTATGRLLVEHAEELSEAISIMETLLSPTRTIVGIERDKCEGRAALKRASSGAARRTFTQLAGKYPQSDPLQLIRALIGREVPSGRAPIDLGCVVVGVPTLYAVWEAVVIRKPLIERVVTVSGGAVQAPANLKARIGTPIGSLLRECGVDHDRLAQVVMGGPLRGYAVSDLRTPVMKSTPAVLALTAEEIHRGHPQQCIECGRCVEVCPMGLSPTRLAKLNAAGLQRSAIREGLLDCTECGLCSYVCPSRVQLVEALTAAKRRYNGSSSGARRHG